MPTLTVLQTILIYAIPILFAITVHEVAHGWVASKLGDPTARMLGRLTLNPIKHIDVVGTIIVPAALFFTTGFLFGWAKPVPISWRNLRSPRRDMALVASAGPLSNLVMALIWGLIIKLALFFYTSTEIGIFIALAQMGKIGLQINLMLLVLNLIPIPPLDGSRVVASLLPAQLAQLYARLEPFGLIILLLLLSTHVLGAILGPSVGLLAALIGSLLGL